MALVTSLGPTTGPSGSIVLQKRQLDLNALRGAQDNALRAAQLEQQNASQMNDAAMQRFNAGMQQAMFDYGVQQDQWKNNLNALQLQGTLAESQGKLGLAARQQLSNEATAQNQSAIDLGKLGLSAFQTGEDSALNRAKFAEGQSQFGASFGETMRQGDITQALSAAKLAEEQRQALAGNELDWTKFGAGNELGWATLDADKRKSANQIQAQIAAAQMAADSSDYRARLEAQRWKDADIAGANEEKNKLAREKMELLAEKNRKVMELEQAKLAALIEKNNAGAATAQDKIEIARLRAEISDFNAKSNAQRDMDQTNADLTRIYNDEKKENRRQYEWEYEQNRKENSDYFKWRDEQEKPPVTTETENLSETGGYSVASPRDIPGLMVEPLMLGQKVIEPNPAHIGAYNWANKIARSNEVATEIAALNNTAKYLPPGSNTPMTYSQYLLTKNIDPNMLKVILESYTTPPKKTTKTTKTTKG